MIPFLLNILLAMAWNALTGDYSPVNFVAGFLIGYVALWMMKFILQDPGYFPKIPQVIGFCFYFAWELTKANIRMAYNVLAPFSKMSPGIVAIPLDITTDIQITLLANMITLTPGTLSMDVSTDRRVIYVHSIVINNPDEFRDSIKNGFERKVMEVTQ